MLLNKENAEFRYADSRLTIKTAGSTSGELMDSVKVDFGPDEFKLRANPENIGRYLDQVTTIGVGKNCVALRSDSLTILVGISTAD
jgi:hypothetical protein